MDAGKIQLLIPGKKKHLKYNLKIISNTINEFNNVEILFPKTDIKLIVQKHIENLCRMSLTRDFMHSCKLENSITTGTPKVLLCVKYARIRVFSDPYFTIKDRITDSVLTQENMGKKKPYTGIF